MCGRYEILDGKLVLTRFGVRTDLSAVDLLHNLEVRPSQHVPVVLADQALQFMKWGLMPSWAREEKIGYKMINARAEGIAEKPSFKRALRSQRCLIPASAFFEWKGDRPRQKTKHRIARRDADLFAFAGLYDTWTSPAGDALTTCTIITTTPNAEVAPIHNRMPVILLAEDEADWLNPDMTEPDAIVEYLRPYPAGLLEAMAVA